jgi:hypothetical protein
MEKSQAKKRNLLSEQRKRKNMVHQGKDTAMEVFPEPASRAQPATPLFPAGTGVREAW